MARSTARAFYIVCIAAKGAKAASFSVSCVYRKPKTEGIGDEVCQGSGVN